MTEMKTETQHLYICSKQILKILFATQQSKILHPCHKHSPYFVYFISTFLYALGIAEES